MAGWCAASHRQPDLTSAAGRQMRWRRSPGASPRPACRRVANLAPRIDAARAETALHLFTRKDARFREGGGLFLAIKTARARSVMDRIIYAKTNGCRR